MKNYFYKNANLKKLNGHVLLLCLTMLIIRISSIGFSAPGEVWNRVIQAGELPNGIQAFTGSKFTERANHASVVFNGKVWIIGGKGDDLLLKNDVWSSEDGESWTEVTAAANFPARKDFGLLAFDNKMWVIGGNNGTTNLTDVWNSTDGITWTQSTAAAYTVNDVCSAFVVYNDMMWAFGYNSTGSASKVFNSTDGITWNSITNDATFKNYIKAIDFSGYLLVIGGCDSAGSGEAETWTTTGGATWTHGADTGLGYRYGFELQMYNGMLYIFGGQILDGVTIKQSVDVFYAFTENDWLIFREYMSFAGRINSASVVFKNNICMYGGNQSLAEAGTFTPLNDIWATSDCKNWIENNVIQRMPKRYDGESVVHNGRMWNVGGSSYEYSYNKFWLFNDVWSTTDGENWDCTAENAGFDPRCSFSLLEFNNKMWVIGGDSDSGSLNDVWYSENGEAWTTATLSAAFTPRFLHSGVVFNGEMWIIGGQDTTGYLNDVWHSSDGITWTAATTSAAFTPRGMHSSFVFDNKIWVVGGIDPVGLLNDTWYSTDGEHWYEATSDAQFDPRAGHSTFVYNNKMWVIGGYSLYNFMLILSFNDVWSSTDGVNWTEETSAADFPSRGGAASAVFDNSMWIIQGNDGASRGDVWRSNDGKNWTYTDGLKNFSNRCYAGGTVFKNKMWLTGGYDLINFMFYSFKADVWNSANGADWTNTISSSFNLVSTLHQAIEFKDNLYLIGGAQGWSYSNEVWRTSDGYQWTPATLSAQFDARGEYSSVVFQDKLWIIAGNNLESDVWSTDNGTTWTAATLNASFSPRGEHTSVVFDNKMWVIGGDDEIGACNDVWQSSDGETWTSATLSAAFAPRYAHQSVVFDGSMWVIGGMGESGEIYNDIWRSSDGVIWTEVIPSKKFVGVFGHSSFVYDNKIWMVGGASSIIFSPHDIYVSGSGPAAESSPSSLNFGTINIDSGTTGPLTVTVSNPLPYAFEPLSIISVTIENDLTGAFSFSSAPYTGNIAVDASKNYEILFNPTVAGIAAANLVITTNDTKKPTITIPLSGNGFDPNSAIAEWQFLK